MLPLILLVLPVQLFCLLDVVLLRGLVPADQEEDDLASALSEIQTIARTVVDAQLVHTASDRLVVAEVARKGNAPDAQVDSRLRIGVAQPLEPLGKLVCPSDLQHGAIV